MESGMDLELRIFKKINAEGMEHMTVKADRVQVKFGLVPLALMEMVHQECERISGYSWNDILAYEEYDGVPERWDDLYNRTMKNFQGQELKLVDYK